MPWPARGWRDTWLNDACDARFSTPVSYWLGACPNKVLEHHAAKLMEQAESQYEESGEKVRLFGETSYAADRWDKERCVIIKSERLEQGLNTRFVVTKLSMSHRIFTIRFTHNVVAWRTASSSGRLSLLQSKHYLLVCKS